MPTLVGEYKATLSIKNSNYTASEAYVYFEITPITTEVKVKVMMHHLHMMEQNTHIMLMMFYGQIMVVQELIINYLMVIKLLQ